MAIDSREKRFSVMNMTLPWLIGGVTPNGTIDDGDKYHLVNLYFGLALDAPVSVETVYLDQGEVVMLTTIDEGVVALGTTIDEGVVTMR